MKELDNIISLLKEAFPTGDAGFVPLMVQAMDLHAKKNNDYARTGGDALGNFTRCSQIKQLYPGIGEVLTTPHGTALDYMLKQFDASMNMLAGGYEGEVEDVETRFFDVFVYSAIFILLWRRCKKDNTCEDEDSETTKHPSRGQSFIRYGKATLCWQDFNRQCFERICRPECVIRSSL